MLEINKKHSIFNVKIIRFAESPYDVDKCHAVNFVSCKEKVNSFDFTCTESLTSVIDLTQDLDMIWKNMSKSSCRYSIKRAQREGITLRVNENYDEFYQIYRSFAREKGISPLFGIGIPTPETMRKYGTLFIAEYKDEILGGHLYLEDSNNLEFWLDASKRLEVDKETATLIGYASRLLHWEAIKYAKEKGIKEFDWGGLWSEEEANKDEKKKAINSFKLSFGGEIVTRYSYQKIYSNSYRLARSVINLAKYRKFAR